MKPIEAGCMAIVIKCNIPENSHLLGKSVRVLEYVNKDTVYTDPNLRITNVPVMDGWLVDLINPDGWHYMSTTNNLMRIDGEYFEEEQIEERLYDHQSN